MTKSIAFLRMALPLLGAFLLGVHPAYGQSGTAPAPTNPAPPLVMTVNGVEETVYQAMFHDGVMPPQAVKQPKPKFPNHTATNVESGTVNLLLVVTDRGTVENIRVVKSLGSDFDAKAIETVRKWKFRPATKDGKPVFVQVAIVVDFRP